ncbi:sensor histidine kinase [Saccharothrix sp. NRRL B-16348]|uniref:sensor histidine kinase n=1 Tax=Saccharothrix sp. NRRL B-16348 TaxID=1415542 RepID=UPI0007C83A41|nr:HAMP domain-containing sensor histidine kinase [Saccharothrix sp. NRRL B-16348]
MRFRPTVRVKLTAVLAAVLLVSGAVLLTAVYLLMAGTVGDKIRAELSTPATPAMPATEGDMPPAAGTVDAAVVSTDTALRALLLYSGLGLLAITLLSVLVAWWLAGRVLRPLHRITATARRLSSENLHERIALAGPRDELTELAETFDLMLDRLERSFDSQRRFVAHASHELRTPLAIQRAAIQIGLRDPDAQRLARVREQMLDANRRTEQLIEGLLVLARSDRGLADRVPVPLHDVVTEVVEQHDHPATARSITVDVAVTPVVVQGDRVLLTQLVANLVGNAVRHNVDGGRLHVRLDATGLRVTNTGPVIDPAELPVLLEPFRRGPRHTGSTDGGVGLGLAIVTSITRAHDGEVTTSALPNGGLEVHVLLPPSRTWSTGTGCRGERSAPSTGHPVSVARPEQVRLPTHPPR